MIRFKKAKKVKKIKKGFTLLELLAVIVILIIIVLITVPIILRIIENAKKDSALDSAYGIRQAVKYYYVSDIYIDVSSDDVFTCDFSNSSCDVLGLTGTIPSRGIVTITATGTLTFTDLVIDGYHITYDPVTEKFSAS